MLTASRPLVADSVENEFVYVYMCVCVCVGCACVHASFRSARRIIPDIATSCQQSSVWSNFTWCPYIWAYTKHLPLETERNVAGVGRWWKVHSLNENSSRSWLEKYVHGLCLWRWIVTLFTHSLFPFFWNRSVNLERSENVGYTADLYFYWFYGSGKKLLIARTYLHLARMCLLSRGHPIVIFKNKTSFRTLLLHKIWISFLSLTFSWLHQN
jgi:hypothetical protein